MRSWKCLRIALGLSAALGLPRCATAEAAQAAPVIPVFIDPGHHLERPDPAGLRAIRFLTSDDYPPFNFTSPDGTLAGYNIDLARAICGLLKLVCSIQARGFDNLVPALQGNAGDAVIASLAITERSRAEVDFSLPTMRTPARFAARAAAPVAEVLPEKVGGLTIGVQAGTAHEAYLRSFFPKTPLKLYTDPESLRAALKTGAIDLMFADGIATSLWLNGTAAVQCCRFAGGPFTESRYFGEGSGIAVRKGDTVLRHALDDALARLTADGTMADLYLKYFPVGFY